MRKYRIYKVKDGFSVWKLKNIGNGYLFDDMGRHFSSEEEAQTFIEEDRRKDGEKMTPGEKAKETRKRHEEARKAKDREKIEIREKMQENCLRVLDDPSASSADRMKAVEILHDLTKGR